MTTNRSAAASIALPLLPPLLHPSHPALICHRAQVTQASAVGLSLGWACCLLPFGPQIKLKPAYTHSAKQSLPTRDCLLLPGPVSCHFFTVWHCTRRFWLISWTNRHWIWNLVQAGYFYALHLFPKLFWAVDYNWDAWRCWLKVLPRCVTVHAKRLCHSGMCREEGTGLNSVSLQPGL